MKKSKMREDSKFAVELAEFIRDNPEKLDAEWAALLARSQDPSIRAINIAMEAAVSVVLQDNSLAKQLRDSSRVGWMADMGTMSW